MLSSMLFQQSLQDLVKGIRSHRRDEAQFIRQKCVEIANECRAKDLSTKTNAVLKLTHLQMMGYSMAFASFHVVEVMCAAEFATKRIGYLAAAQSFSPTTDVLLLTTNQFKKDLTNGRMQDCSQALTCLAKLVTESLACDLSGDVAMLLSSPRPYIRKKTLLVLYRFIAVYPATLGVISEKFRQCLQDPDPGVVCAAVTVTCELARSSPRDFLGLAPALYALLTSSSNNWMLIKIVKLMGVLTPLEPRLGKKLVGPLTNLMRTTRAKSLLYECCCTVTLGLMDYPEAVQLCGERLSEFTVDPDQNLKYLGLLSMRRLASAHPSVAMQHRDLILDCLDDVDIGIRMRALELVSEFVTRRTIRDITRILLRKLRSANESAPAGLSAVDALDSAKISSALPASEMAAETEAASVLLLDPETPFRDALARQLLVPGTFVSGEGYPFLSSGDDFSWYIGSVLGGLARTPRLSSQVSDIVASQLTELIARVEAVRPATLAVAAELLTESSQSEREENLRAAGAVGAEPVQTTVEPSLLDAEPVPACDDDEVTGHEMTQVNGNGSEISALGSAQRESPTASERTVSRRGRPAAPLSSAVVASAAWVLGEHAELLKHRAQTADMLMWFPVRTLSSVAQVALVSAMVKVYCACDPENARGLRSRLLARLEESVASDFAEVSDRAILMRQLVSMTKESDVLEAVRSIFEGILLPVDSRAQDDIAVPEDLDLDVPLLDTGGVDLFTFLNGDSSRQSLNFGADSGDEDDLFRELEHNGSGRFGRKGPDAKVTMERSSASPFHLGAEEVSRGGDEKSPQSDKAASPEVEAHYASERSSAVPVFTGSGASVPVLLGGDEEQADGHKARGKKSRRKKGLSAKSQTVEEGAYGSAFEGLFDVPPDSATADKPRRTQKKKKKRSSKSRPAESADGTKGTSPSLISSDLIDLGTDENVDAATSGPMKEQKSAPAHLGNQMDLLM